MGKHDFGYFFHEGLSNMFSHGFMSFAAIGITVACLLIMGTFTLVAVNADANLEGGGAAKTRSWPLLTRAYTEEQAKALQSKLEAVPNVASATFISPRRRPWRTFIRRSYPDEEMFPGSGPGDPPGPLCHQWSRICEQQSETVEKIAECGGHRGGISAYEELTNGFITVRNIATVVCVALIAILFM